MIRTVIECNQCSNQEDIFPGLGIFKPAMPQGWTRLDKPDESDKHYCSEECLANAFRSADKLENYRQCSRCDSQYGTEISNIDMGTEIINFEIPKILCGQCVGEIIHECVTAIEEKAK
jgi:hypothetical protein